MDKNNVLFGIIGLLLGCIIGFLFANNLNQSEPQLAPMSQPQSATNTTSQNPNLPPDHPQVGGNQPNVVPQHATVWYYFRPQDGNPFVIAWLGIIFLLSCVFAWWVFLAGGARKVSELNLMAMLGHRTTKPMSENMVKFFAVLGVAIFPVWVYLAVSMNAPLPR